tara:strand:+ start:126 stop:587 length:462 start_codon:yes stop_codon:yes gene_type:complete
MSARKLYVLFLGNLATSFWFIPWVSKILHSIRGVQFKDSKSVFLGRGVIIDNRYPELISIGRDVWITARVTILTHSFTSNLQRNLFGYEEKVASVTIKDGVFIGVGSIICPGVIISENSYIAAGSVVTKNVAPNSLYGGNPAVYIKKLDLLDL